MSSGGTTIGGTSRKNPGQPPDELGKPLWEEKFQKDSIKKYGAPRWGFRGERGGLDSKVLVVGVGTKAEINRITEKFPPYIRHEQKRKKCRLFNNPSTEKNEEEKNEK